jgi:hypothetical protein
VALVGGGFSMESGNPLLDDYVLGLCAAERPRVCFLPSASGFHGTPRAVEGLRLLPYSNAAARGYRLDAVDGQVVETQLATAYLGDPSLSVASAPGSTQTAIAA